MDSRQVYEQIIQEARRSAARGHLAKSIRALTHAMAFEAHWCPEDAVLLAQCYSRNGARPAALRVLDDCLTRFPTHSSALGLRSQLADHPRNCHEGTTEHDGE